MNDETKEEEFVQFTDCGQNNHTICVIYHEKIWPDGFTCNSCLKNKNMKRPQNRSRAHNLPTTDLSEFIERRVNKLITSKGIKDKVIIRLLSNEQKSVSVKPRMAKKFVGTGKMNASFDYREKAIYAFQEQEFNDVCFFAFYAQEYRSQCNKPNANKIYVSYIVSVHWIELRQLGTLIYQQDIKIFERQHVELPSY